MGNVTDFAVAVDWLDDNCAVVRVDGEVDMASVSELEQAIARAASAPHLVIDLGSCTFLDSAGTRVIAETIRKAPRVSVVATDPGVLRVLEITAVDSMISVHASVEDAL